MWLVVVAAIMLACSSCSPRPPSCTPEARANLFALYARAADGVIADGACDKYAKVEQCPAYMALETHFAAAAAALCQ